MILIAFGVGMIVAYGSVAALIVLLSLKPASRGYQPLPGTRMPPPPMPRVKPAQDADFWDVAQPVDAKQPLYMYGIGAELEE